MRFLHDSPMTFAICRASPYCHAKDAAFFQTNHRVHKILVRNSGAGNGCANFMGAWEHALFLQEKPMSITFLVFWGVGGGGILGFWGEGGVPILFLWAWKFSDFVGSFLITVV